MIEHLSGTGCAYGRNADDPTPRCPKSTTWHISLLALDMVSVNAVGACDEHYPLARQFVGDRFVRQHAFAALCAWPGVLWNFRENRCVLDVSGVEQPARELAEASA